MNTEGCLTVFRFSDRGTFYQGYYCSKCGVGVHKECLETIHPCKMGESPYIYLSKSSHLKGFQWKELLCKLIYEKRRYSSGFKGGRELKVSLSKGQTRGGLMDGANRILHLKKLLSITLQYVVFSSVCVTHLWLQSCSTHFCAFPLRWGQCAFFLGKCREMSA